QNRWCIGDESFSSTTGDVDTAWEQLLKMVTRHDAGMCQILREEIDSLLVFAGLFSGVLTAFIMEAYKWLLEEPDDLTADYLRQIIALMSNSTISTVQPTTARPTLPDNVVSLINGLWFSSLILSLTSALVGIVSKQWLREYLRENGRSHETNLAVRQVKYEGLTNWYVGAVVTTIPLLLQIALFLFLIGVVYLLWYIQPVVAGIISGFGLVVAIFFIATTILPTAQFILYRLGLLRLHTVSQVPFKSAQALLFLRISCFLINAVAWLHHSVTSLGAFDRRPPFKAPFPAYPGWPEWDLNWTRRQDESARWSYEPTSIARCLGFIESNFEHQYLREWMWKCLWSMRENVANAVHVLHCVRRTPAVKAEFPTSQDSLAQAVLPLLHPGIAPQATVELISMSLLDPQSEVCVEHNIRVFNGLLVSCGPKKISRIVYRSLRDSISDISRSCSKAQLFLVAQDVLRRSQHDEDFFKTPLDVVSGIIDYIGHGEVQEEFLFDTDELSLDFCGEVVAWLERYPDPSHNWRDYKSRVLWCTGIAVLLTHRLARFTRLEEIPKSHSRLPSVYALYELVDAKIAIIPPATFVKWTPDRADMDEFRQAKSVLEAILEASSESDLELPPGARIHLTPQPSTPRRQRIISTITAQPSDLQVRAFFMLCVCYILTRYHSDLFGALVLRDTTPTNGTAMTRRR
ncbi:hypothetical protein FB107DRAFT_202794, partial [Schizophyllum commune]